MTKAEKAKLIEFRKALSDLCIHSDVISETFAKNTSSCRYYEGEVEAFYQSIKVFDNFLVGMGIPPEPRRIVPLNLIDNPDAIIDYF